MPEPTLPTTALVALLRANDPSAPNALLAHTQDRLRQLARLMLRKYPQVGRWEQADDVHQKALIRLWKRVTKEAPKSARHFWNLASRILRHVLVEAARRYRGPQGLAASHQSDPDGLTVAARAAPCDPPETLAQWTQFHRIIGRLPDDLREVIQLRWYQGMTLVEVAEVLGVSPSTTKRLWVEARTELKRRSGEEPPDGGD